MDMFLFLQRMLQQKNDIINCLAGHYHGNSFGPDNIQLIEDSFLKEPVVAIHCKAGKGRTGLVIVCFMLYIELFENVEEAIEHYDKQRTLDGAQGLSIQSQKRQVYHFKHFLDKTCQGGSRGYHKNYIMNSLKNFKACSTELDQMENCAEYQYMNSLNIFSLTLGPFEKAADQKRKLGIGENIEDAGQTNLNLQNEETQADEEDDELVSTKKVDDKPEESAENEFVRKIN
jgi:hypothetical protein